MTGAEQRAKETVDIVRGFVMASKPGAQTLRRKFHQDRSATDEGAAPRFETTAQTNAHEALTFRAEAMAGLLDELTERVHLLRDELWQLRAELAQRGGER